MENSYYDQLLPHFNYIISELEISFMTKHRCSRESDLFMNFHDLLTDRVHNFMKKYRPPENHDEHFKLIRGFITQYRKTIYYSGTVKDTYTKTNKIQSRQINIVTDDEKRFYHHGITSDQLISEENTEDKVIEMDLQKRVTRGFNLFMTYLSPFEKQFFKGMVQGKSTRSIVSDLGNGGFEPPSYDISQRLRNTLEFRLTCFFAQDREILYDKNLVLKSLNKFSKLNKRVFGISKLETIPTQEMLEYSIKKGFVKKDRNNSGIEISEKKQIVKSFDPDSKIQVYGTKYFAKSKVDFDGKKHDHYVVYIDHYLNMYDHVTKQNRSLRIS